MKMNEYQNINYLWSGLIIEELIRHGIDYFCLSPGSRSAPLAMALASHPMAQKVIHFDERGTGFHALGYTAATRKPCVVITTSGTAVANLLPAVVEASKKKLPLIILTADRPPELRHTGANQTINQVSIFGLYVRWFFDLPTPTDAIDPCFVLTTIDQAVARAQGELKGPVHINCMFREPLSPVKEKFSIKKSGSLLDDWEKTKRPFTQYILPDPITPDGKLNAITDFFVHTAKGIIVVGKLNNENERTAVVHLSEKIHWPIFPDISSGLRLSENHKNIIHYFDRMLTNCTKNQLPVDGILHLGGRITSNAYYQFIKTRKIKNYCMVVNHPLRSDPLHWLTHRIQMPIDSFVYSVDKRLKARAPHAYINTLRQWDDNIDQLLDSILLNNELNEFAVSRLISKHIPGKSGLMLSNSLPIREMDSYGGRSASSIFINGNRGASGIDGIVATASGYAAGLQNSVTVLIGDLALLHDLNSLALVKNNQHCSILIVLNNHGGGIFSFLPIADNNPYFEKYFTTPHNYHFSAIAGMFGLDYSRPQSTDEFVDVYTAALTSRTSTIIEVVTDRTQNTELALKIDQEIKELLK